MEVAQKQAAAFLLKLPFPLVNEKCGVEEWYFLVGLIRCLPCCQQFFVKVDIFCCMSIHQWFASLALGFWWYVHNLSKLFGAVYFLTCIIIEYFGLLYVAQQEDGVLGLLIATLCDSRTSDLLWLII